MQSTEWRPVPDFEDRYEVSEDGAVRTLDLRVLDEQICASMNYRGCCDAHADGQVL